MGRDSAASGLRLAIVVSHPIQHFVPQYRSLAEIERLDTCVIFGCRAGLDEYVDPGFGKAVAWDGLSVADLDHRFVTSSTNPPRVSELGSLRRSLADFDPHVVLTYGYASWLQRAAYLWARATSVDVAYVSDAHDRGQVDAGPRRAVRNGLVRQYFKGVSHFLTVGDANEDFYRREGVSPARFIRMHFPIDVARFDRAWADRDLERRKVRRSLGIGNSRLMLLSVGKFVPWKSHVDLIEALRVLEGRGLVADVVIVGSGPIEASIRAAAASLQCIRVHFPGFVQPGELANYYAAADIYVHPAPREPHALAISEAGAMGLPSVVADSSGSWGLTDDVAPHISGVTFAAGDVIALAEAITEVIDGYLNEDVSAMIRSRAVRFQERSHRLAWLDLMDRVRRGHRRER